MTEKKIYDLVKDLLTLYPPIRNSDKKLIWAVWTRLGLVTHGRVSSYISKENFYLAPASESVTRARRKIQELHPELQATSSVKRERTVKEKTKGSFVFRENTAVFVKE